jgi:hypothetical protein
MDFLVTTSDLESLSRGLSGLLGELEQAGDVRSLSAAAAENPQLEAAIEEFLGRWTADLQGLQENLASLAQRLGSASVGYEQEEQHVTGAFWV